MGFYFFLKKNAVLPAITRELDPSDRGFLSTLPVFGNRMVQEGLVARAGSGCEVRVLVP